jgi:hypothetical protein
MRQSELDCVSEAIRLRSCDRGHPVHPNVVHHLASAAIAALDGFRELHKRKNCKHHHRVGTACLGGDGQGWSTWFCPECGESYDSRQPVTQG